jgi:hypothetical protein
MMQRRKIEARCFQRSLTMKQFHYALIEFVSFFFSSVVNYRQVKTNDSP